MSTAGDAKLNKASDKKAATKATPVNGGRSAEFRGWVNVDITEAQKQDFAGWVESGGVWDVWEELCAAGITLSVKWAAKEECFMAKAFWEREGQISSGYCVTMRAGEAQKAFWRVLYVVKFILGDNWAKHAVQERKKDW